MKENDFKNNEQNEPGYDVWFAPPLEGRREAAASEHAYAQNGKDVEKIDIFEIAKNIEDKEPISNEDSTLAEEEAQMMANKTLQGKLSELEDIVFQKGLRYAIEVAKNNNNPFLLDQFQGMLPEIMHKLKKQKKR